MNIIAEWNAADSHEAVRHTAWVRDFQAALLPFAAKGVYTNFLGNEDKEQVQASYGSNYERLVNLKNKYDPYNIFHFNPNIQPTIGVQYKPAVQLGVDLTERQAMQGFTQSFV